MRTDDDRAVLEALRHLSDQQISRAERVRASSYQTFAYLTGIFSLAQGGVLVAFGRGGVQMPASVLALAIASVVALAATGIIVVLSTRIQGVKEISPDDVMQADSTSIERDESVERLLALLYAERTREHSTAIDGKRKLRWWIPPLAITTITIIAAEFIVAFSVRF